MKLDLDVASATQALEPIPAGTLVELIMQINPGGLGNDGLLKRTAKGDAIGISASYTVLNAPHAGRKFNQFHVLEGPTVGHATARSIVLALLRAIREAVLGVNPLDNSPAAIAQRAGAELSHFNGARFLAELAIERGGKKPDGTSWADKNIIHKVLRAGDPNYRQLDQTPTTPPTQPAATNPSANGAGTPSVVSLAVAKPGWAS
jgi:hypothetical protein